VPGIAKLSASAGEADGNLKRPLYFPRGRGNARLSLFALEESVRRGKLAVQAGKRNRAGRE